MRISHVAVRNYRSLEVLDLDITDYTALVGANGAGKSSVLYALDWFFRGYDLDESDITLREGAPGADDIRVTVTFADLTAADRAALGQYGRGDFARFRRSWHRAEKGTKVIGRAMQGPGFSEVRRASTVREMRAAYRALPVASLGLPGLAGNVPKSDITAALDEWENQPEHVSQLVEVDDVDAAHMFGFNGSNIIRDRIRLVLVPAATDMPSQLSDASKGSALAELIGAVIADAGARAREEWLTTHGSVIEELNSRVRDGVQSSVTTQAERINSYLTGMVPDASVSFIPTVPEWQPKSEATVATSVTIDGSTTDIVRQGHGVQRAVMIALFQSLVPDAVTGGSLDAGAPAATQSDAPALVICIEEPEIYQHPVRARSFGRVLAELSNQPGAQVVVATHSPYFVAPAQFESIRRFRIIGGRTGLSEASIQEVCVRSGADEAAVRKVVEKQVPTTFSEGFFADAVVLVEGDTDRAVIETLALRLGLPLDERGISVLVLGGKRGLRVPYGLFGSLDVPTFVVADGDADGAARRYPREDQAGGRTQADASNRAATEGIVAWLPSSTARVGTIPYVFAEPTVITDDYLIWRDDLESELAAWPSFVTALTEAGCQLRQKNALAYRTAVLDADLADIPSTLREAVEAIAAFG